MASKNKTCRTEALKFEVYQLVGRTPEHWWKEFRHAWYVYETTTWLYLCQNKVTGNVYLRNGTGAGITNHVSTTPGCFRTRAMAREAVKVARLQNKILVK